MEIKHKAIKSDLFQISGTYVFDISIVGEEDGLGYWIRIELSHSVVDQRKYCYKIWNEELFDIQSCFPEISPGKPVDDPSTEDILTGFRYKHIDLGKEFNAGSHEEALDYAINDLCLELNQILKDHRQGIGEPIEVTFNDRS